MGQFVNPDNELFKRESTSEIYIDKTGLIRYTNHVFGSPQRMFICNSRPRRFGKSYAADMLTAYYSKGCDSRDLFKDLDIGRDPDFEKHLNKCDVIRFDVQWCISMAKDMGTDPIDYINQSIVADMKKEYPDFTFSDNLPVFGAMNEYSVKTGRRFVVIIDEWDSIIRDRNNDEHLIDSYVDFLRGMFKGTEPMNYISLAYMTGILPIKRQKTQSALNNFDEYTMLQAAQFEPYIGFTDEEVKSLCREYDMNYEEMKKWYDGYLLGDTQVYNPNSVCKCIDRRKMGNYWTATGSFAPVRDCLNMNFDGMKQDIIDMLSGVGVKISTLTFENRVDRSAFKSKNDVFTYMIHLGYLAYDEAKQKAFIPNEEIRQVLGAEISESHWTEFDSFEKKSDELLDATIEGDSDAIATAITKIHDRYASAIWYNNENSLASTINIAYLSTLKYYFRPVREMPTGKGFADVVYLPLPEYLSDIPALVIELKWDKDVSTAMDQIRDRQYPESIKDYTGDIILVGISYDKKTKEHTCIIDQTKI